MPELESRFWEKVDKGGPDECWEWTARTLPRGYGHISIENYPEYAHRVVMEMEGHDIEGKQVNHTCDNPSCVNPNHLYVGTQSENVQDSYDRDRRDDVDYASGEDHGQSKLTREEVQDIRDSDSNQTELAEEYGVSQSLISQIQRGKWWSDDE